jgi:nicotinate-nucleotide adenylyltransferase
LDTSWDISCLYFGTFNPIHSGHLMIAQAVLQQFSESLGVRSVTFIPAGTPPHRHQQTDLLDARQRLRMVSLATADNPAFQVDDIELRRHEPSYTVETLRLLEKQGRIRLPVPFIIGADALANLSTWREPQALTDMACFLQAPRPDWGFVEHLELDGKSLPLNTKAIAMPALALSSSWVRDTLQRTPQDTQALRYFLPGPVRRYIRDNHLYR